MLVFLEYNFQFLINKALLASNGVDRQNFIGKSAGFRGAIGNASSYFIEVRVQYLSQVIIFFFFFLVLLFFVLFFVFFVKHAFIF